MGGGNIFRNHAHAITYQSAPLDIENVAVDYQPESCNERQQVDSQIDDKVIESETIMEEVCLYEAGARRLSIPRGLGMDHSRLGILLLARCSLLVISARIAVSSSAPHVELELVASAASATRMSEKDESLGDRIKVVAGCVNRGCEDGWCEV